MISKEDQITLKNGWEEYFTLRSQVMNFITLSNITGFILWLFWTLNAGSFDLFVWIKSLGFSACLFATIYLSDSFWFRTKAKNMDFPFSLVGFYSRIPYHILMGIVGFGLFFKLGIHVDIVSLQFVSAIFFELVVQSFVFWFLVNRLRKLYLVNI